MDKSKNSRQQGQSRSLANSQREYAAETLRQETRRVAGLAPETTEENDDTSENTSLAAAGGTKPFATLLSFLLKNDRSEIQRLAREIGVSDNTIYRWINRTSKPCT